MSKKRNKSKKKNKKIRISEDPLIVAVRQGNLGQVQDIVNQVGLNCNKDWLEGYALLCTALKFHRSQVALWLLSKNCKINNDQEPSALHLAVLNNEVDIVLNLIEKGACINVKNDIGETPLHISCRNQNVEITKLLLQKDNTVVDIENNCLTTPLHIAVEKECLEIVNILLEYKVNVNTYTVRYDYKGFTPLHIAINKRNKEIVEILLKHDANIKAVIGISHLDLSDDLRGNLLIYPVVYEGYLPLHLATEMGDYSIINLLLDHGANVNDVIENSGLTPLHIAVPIKEKEIVLLLLKNKADFCAKTKEGKSLLHSAVENDWAEFVKVLMHKNANVNEQTIEGETPLYIAVEMGDEDIVDLLLYYHADVNIKHINNQSPLHVAAEFNLEIVKKLLENGAKIDELNDDDETPLTVAVKNNDLEIITELLKYKPNIYNQGNKSAFSFVITNNDQSYLKTFKLLLNYGFTITTEDIYNSDLLYNCVCHEDIETVEFLLSEHRIDINLYSNNPKYDFILHKAISCKNNKMTELLIKHNCNLNAIDERGQTPVGYAIEHKNLKILDLLLTSGAEIKNIADPFLTVAKKDDTFLVRTLLRYGADINISDEFGTTALHFAAWNKQPQLVSLLLSKNAYINTTDNKVDKIAFSSIDTQKNDSYKEKFKKQVITSPLHIAVSKKCKDLCLTFLEHHANVNSKDGNGRTALHIASAIKSTEQKKMIEILLNYGADINVTDDFNRLPVYYIYNHTCICSIAFQNQYELDSECECDSYEDYDLNEVITIFIKHLILLSMMNKHVDENNLKIISQSPFSESLQISSLQEISKMKEKKVWNNVSFYDILTKKSNSLAFYACNEDIVRAFETSNYKNDFPLYCDKLKEQFDAAKVRKTLLQSAMVSFNNLIKFQLPEIIFSEIFQYLTLNDLNNITITDINYSVDNIESTRPLKKLKVCR